jgi:methionyl-tRNA formyltransferase
MTRRELPSDQQRAAARRAVAITTLVRRSATISRSMAPSRVGCCPAPRRLDCDSRSSGGVAFRLLTSLGATHLYSRSVLRLVILTGEGLQHRYVANALSTSFPEELQAIVVAQQARPSSLRKLRTWWRRYTIRQLASRVCARTYGVVSGRSRRHRVALARSLVPGGAHEWRRPELVRRVPTVNGGECQALLRDLAPDIVAVYGTAVIKAPIIRLAGRAILNMHTGLSPRYRGADTIFWPLHNEEPQCVGVTIHLLDEGVDSGPIIRTGRPVITPDDDEDSLFCKCVVLGAQLYEEAIREVATGSRQHPPQDLRQGREYRFVDRTLGAEWRVRRLLRGGLLRRFAETSQ